MRLFSLLESWGLGFGAEFGGSQNGFKLCTWLSRGLGPGHRVSRLITDVLDLVSGLGSALRMHMYI